MGRMHPLRASLVIAEDLAPEIRKIAEGMVADDDMSKQTQEFGAKLLVVCEALNVLAQHVMDQQWQEALANMDPKGVVH